MAAPQFCHSSQVIKQASPPFQRRVVRFGPRRQARLPDRLNNDKTCRWYM